jgi:hypothetical protein
VPLLDHFHPPLSERRPWESFHAMWASTLADLLNRDVLPPGYVALEHVHAGAAVEIDGASLTDQAAAAPLLLPALFPPGCTVEIVTTEGGRALAAAIELVSPANKDRPVQRRLFAAKCATYLSQGVGLIIVDVVTSRPGNLHNELTDLLGLEAAFQMPAGQSLYVVAYRPLRVGGDDRIETWPSALAVGQPLPTMPLSLEAEHCVPLDLEAAYAEACGRRRVDEALG